MSKRVGVALRLQPDATRVKDLPGRGITISRKSCDILTFVGPSDMSNACQPGFPERLRAGNVAFTVMLLCIRRSLAALIRRLWRIDEAGHSGPASPNSYGFNMSREDLVLAILASASGRSYSPAQLQKTAFLITTNLPNVVNEGPGFHFVPYDYGPFDKNVYIAATALQARGDAEIVPSPWGRWVNYAASNAGIERGQELLKGLPDNVRAYIASVSSWALSQSFSSLVKAIYDAYPAMRANSIFRDPT